METLLTGETGSHSATGEQHQTYLKMREAAGRQDTVRWKMLVNSEKERNDNKVKECDDGLKEERWQTDEPIRCSRGGRCCNRWSGG